MNLQNHKQLKYILAEVKNSLQKKIGDNDSKFIDRIFENGLEKYLNRISRIGFENKERVLDAGCGFGQWSLSLASKNNNVFSCDSSSIRIEFIKDLCKSLEIKNIYLSLANLNSLEYPDNYFDAVFCYGVIFLTPWKETIGQFRRILKPGGKIYVNFNDIGWYLFLWETEHNKATDYDPKLVASKAFLQTIRYERNQLSYVKGDHYIISTNEMREFLNKNGFKQIQSGPEGSVTLENKTIPNEPFFKDEYKGMPCVQELLATKI